MTMWTSPFSASYPFFVIISLTNCVGTAIKCDLRISLVVLYVHAILSHLCWYSVSKLVWGTQRNEPCGLCCGHQWSVVFSYLFVICGCQKIISNRGGGGSYYYHFLAICESEKRSVQTSNSLFVCNLEVSDNNSGATQTNTTPLCTIQYRQTGSVYLLTILGSQADLAHISRSETARSSRWTNLRRLSVL